MDSIQQTIPAVESLSLQEGFHSLQQVVIHICRVGGLWKHSGTTLGQLLLNQRRVMNWCIVMGSTQCAYSPKLGCWFMSLFQKSCTTTRLWLWWLCWLVIYSSVDSFLNMGGGVITSCYWSLLLRVILQ